MSDFVFQGEPPNITTATSFTEKNTTARTTNHTRYRPPHHRQQVTPPPPPVSPDNLVPTIDYNYDFLRYDDFQTRFPALPDWMEEVFRQQPSNNPQHHHDMLVDPNNKFIVLTCYVHSNSFSQNMGLEDCGGLTDRLLLLPLQLWMAHKSGRRLLIKYYKPWPLEEFLVPPPTTGGFEWRLPEGYLMDEWYQYGNRTRDQYKADRFHHWEMTFMRESHAQERVLFMNSNLLAIPMLKDNRMDTIIGASSEALWPAMFRRMFQPSPQTAQAIHAVTAQAQQQQPLLPGSYGAMHIRARWPDKRFKFAYKHQKWWRADKFGGAIDMTDPQTFQSIALLADHAVTCAARIMPDDNTARQVYVASDASEVITYLKNDSPLWADNKDANSIPEISFQPAGNHTNNTVYSKYDYDVPAWQVDAQKAKSIHIIARADYQIEPPHFDRNRWPSPSFALFVDLWIMAHAKCHSQGVGGFGRFGSVLSGSRRTCATRHRDYEGIVKSCATPAERKAWRAQHPEIVVDTWAITDKKNIT